jgi:hypothetical protein
MHKLVSTYAENMKHRVAGGVIEYVECVSGTFLTLQIASVTSMTPELTVPNTLPGCRSAAAGSANL